MKNWECPLCYNLVPDGALICRGCGGRVSYPASRKRNRIAFSVIAGFMGACIFGSIGWILMMPVCFFICLYLGIKLPMDKIPRIEEPPRCHSTHHHHH